LDIKWLFLGKIIENRLKNSNGCQHSKHFFKYIFGFGLSKDEVEMFTKLASNALVKTFFTNIVRKEHFKTKMVKKTSLQMSSRSQESKTI
jgi:hypothetical protein